MRTKLQATEKASCLALTKDEAFLRHELRFVSPYFSPYFPYFPAATTDAVMALFDAYLMVDWSAAAVPRRGRDSIWIGLTARLAGGGLRLTRIENPATRAAATERIVTTIARLVADGKRVLAGFDFPFGYPAGTARRLGHSGLPWRHMWQELDHAIEDDKANRNNRFDVAEELNRRLSGEAFPFWGLAREANKGTRIRGHNT